MDSLQSPTTSISMNRSPRTVFIENEYTGKLNERNVSMITNLSNSSLQQTLSNNNIDQVVIKNKFDIQSPSPSPESKPLKERVQPLSSSPSTRKPCSQTECAQDSSLIFATTVGGATFGQTDLQGS